MLICYNAGPMPVPVYDFDDDGWEDDKKSTVEERSGEGYSRQEAWGDEYTVDASGLKTI